MNKVTFGKYYKFSTMFAVIAVILGAVMGYCSGGIAQAVKDASSIAILGILEISLSFDNAVLNAKKLEDMDQYWRAWFIKWGMIIAVFGMRLVFPIIIVAILGHMAPWTAVDLAISKPTEYSEILSASHYLISGFGGAFLMMVAMEFFLDHEKDFHWISWLERPLAAIGHFGLKVDAVLTLAIVGVISFFIPKAEQVPFVIAGVCGIVLFTAVHFLKEYLEGQDEAESSTAAQVGVAVAKNGLAGVIYLEILDASMSFDGVIGAFAITTNIFIVMLGLGVGAFYVRSMTLHMVDSKTLSEYRYLEHGALWAIFALATIMLIGPMVHVSEIFTGCVGALLVGVAVWHSHVANKREAV